MIGMNRERAARTAAQAKLDPASDWHEIYRRLTLWELPVEARFGFQLAFYRPFAVPRMAEVLRKTGHFQRDTMRRAYDTGLVMHEILWGGVDSHRGQQMIKLMNKLHERSDIYPEDMRYILNSLIVVPTRFMETYGWRKPTKAERVATWRFFDELGERMGIEDRGCSYGESENQFTVYEAAMLAPSEAGNELTGAVLAALRDQIPRPVRPLAAQVTSSLVGDPHVSRALGLPAPSTVLSAGSFVASIARRLVEQARPPVGEASFSPGMAAGDLYPRGYKLGDLGPKQ